ncbi:MAG: AI-2E family transporter [Christensenellales bacterium]
MLPKEGYKKIAVILFYLVVGLLFAYLFFKYLFSALLPFLIAYVIAFALQGVIAFLHNRLHFPKKLASLLLVTLTSGLFFLLVYLIVARVYEELSALTVSVRNFIDSLRNDPDFARTWINRINDAFPFFDIEKPLTEFWLNIDARLEQLLSVLAEKLSGAVIPLLGGILTVVPNAFLGIFIVIISS